MWLETKQTILDTNEAPQAKEEKDAVKAQYFEYYYQPNSRSVVL